MMAKPNRYRKLFLSEAWQYYWSELFSSGVDWRADLESEIRKRLYFPGDTGGSLVGDESEREAPPWANDLEIDVQGNFVDIKFQGAAFGSLLLFAAAPLLVMSNWKRQNPLEVAGSPSGMTGTDRDNIQEFIFAAVRDCGNIIRNQFLCTLRVSEHPKFDIYCRPSDDVFSTEKKLPVSGLSAISGIDIMKNELTDRLGLPVLSEVQIKLRQLSLSKAGPRGSFQEHDAPLIEEMKRRIDQERACSVREAAHMVIAKAGRQRGSMDESVLRRLQSGFSQKYSGYTNRPK